jgi:hypothetical protein
MSVRPVEAHTLKRGASIQRNTSGELSHRPSVEGQPDPAKTTTGSPHCAWCSDARSSLGDAVVKVGDAAARTLLIDQLKLKARVPGEGVFAAT